MALSIPKYPYPAYLNIANFVSLKLTSSNYLLWKTQFLSLVESQDLIGFINGDTPAPASETEGEFEWYWQTCQVHGRNLSPPSSIFLSKLQNITLARSSLLYKSDKPKGLKPFSKSWSLYWLQIFYSYSMWNSS